MPHRYVPIATNDLIIRPAAPGDAPHFIALWEVLKQETEGLLFESPTESKVPVTTGTRSQEKSKPAYDNILLVESSDRNCFVGFVAGTRCQAGAHSNSLEIIIALRKTDTNKGWGYKLLLSMERWALDNNYKSLTLNVSATNAAALALYKKFGFEVTKIEQNALRTPGGYVSMYAMQKNLHEVAVDCTG